MAGYILLILATLCGNAKEFAAKKGSGALDTISKKLWFGLVRTSVCALLSLGLWLLSDGGAAGKMGTLIAVFSGISQSACMIFFISAARGCAYVRLNIFNQAGMVIPCILAAPLLGESVSLSQWIAICVLVPSISLCSGKSKSQQGSRLKLSEFVLLLFVWITSGTNGFLIKLYAHVGDGTSSYYNFVTFVVAAAVFALAFLLLRAKGESVSLPRRHYTVIVPVMVAALYLYTFLQTEAAKHLDSMIMFPLKTVLGLGVSALIAVVLLREKLSAKNIVGLVLVAASFVIISLG